MSGDPERPPDDPPEAGGDPVQGAPPQDSPPEHTPAESAAPAPVDAEPAAEEPVMEEPAAEEASAAAPASEAPALEEPEADEPVAAEPVVEQLEVEQPAMEEPVVEAPVTPEPIEQPPAEPENVVAELVQFPEPAPRAAPALEQEAEFEEEMAPEEAFEQEPEPYHPWRDDIPPEDREDLFGVLEIPLPDERLEPTRHARDAQRTLDLDLGRIKRTKRFGLVGTIFAVLFVALFLAPVTWVGVYRFIEAPGTVLMLQRAAEGQRIRHNPVPFTRMSPYIVRSVIAAEDSNFCTHHGFDVAAIQDAMEANADGGNVRGGSTISQQTAKNLFLWPSRSWVRKAFEAYFTSLVEFMWPKQRIIEAYLNAAEWGDGNFGVEAAAQARFGVHAADLTPLQAARLAAVLPSPNKWRADSPGPYVRRRAGTIVARAREVQIDGGARCALAIDAAPARR